MNGLYNLKKRNGNQFITLMCPIVGFVWKKLFALDFIYIELFTRNV